MKIFSDHPLKNYNTFSIDVNAKFFVEINSITNVNELLNSKEYLNEPTLLIGGGSNILFTNNYDGLICKVSLDGIKFIDEDDESVLLEAAAGVDWNDFVRYTIKNNYGGVENLILIPGTVGAAPIQNIGAYGQKLADTFHSLEGIMLENGENKTLLKDDCKFAYRDSIFKNELKNKFVITSVKFRLNKNPIAQISYQDVKEEVENQHIDNPTIKDVSDIVLKIRKAKLPDPEELSNAGSFFKNPVISIEMYKSINDIYPDLKSYPADENNVKIPAAWLIEKCGLKGKKVGNVATYPNQPLVIVNYGATGKEVLDFANMIRENVQNIFDVKLEYEVNII